MRTLELLAPARDLACGLAAIDHGADAVYIGASDFGARNAAGNSVDDVRQLCDYAHQFGVKIYVTVNTLIYENELDAAYGLLLQLAQAHVDAILVQDMAAVELVRRVRETLGYAPALHASTQCDTRTAAKVGWLRRQGFARAVLARELSLDEIRAIHEQEPSIELEAFVHGALCVSYSGVCYASQHCFGRSANRGACAQFCRMKFDLLDSDGAVIEQDRHLLSLKDMCRVDDLEAMADAGVDSFKIEGRLKTADYVKNVVAAYSMKLDRVVGKHPDKYRRSSLGRVDYHFTPNLSKTFNRGFTSYFLHGRKPDIASFDTPKALGEMVGKVKKMGRDFLTVAGVASFANGDGLCFMNDKHELEGFRVNRVDNGRLFPFKMPGSLRPGMTLYRNQDVSFEKLLSGDTANRRIPVMMTYGLTDDGFRLEMRVVGNYPQLHAAAAVTFEHQAARRAQSENIRLQLSKLGNTPFCVSADDILIAKGAADCFIPSSLLSDLRRSAATSLQDVIVKEYGMAEESVRDEASQQEAETAHFEYPQDLYDRYTYLYNISNSLAKAFYAKRGVNVDGMALEVHEPPKALVMQCRHCLRYALGHCVKRGGRPVQWREPLFLRLGDGRRFRLEFRCDLCQMNIYVD